MHWWPIARLGAAFRDRSLTPSDYLEHLLDRIARIDPLIHAFVRVDRAGARAAAAAATRAFRDGTPAAALCGIPVGIKDVIDVAGLPTTCHSALRRDAPAPQDAALVARLRTAGAILLGKLATHEFAIGGPAFDLPWPPARNPWNPDHHPGGSSSGAGAGLAAGLFPAAIGTDTAGSIRNPAGACGVVGLKPTRGLVPLDGVFPLAPSLDHAGPMARCAADIAVLLDAIADTPLPKGTRDGVAGLRIGVVGHFHRHDMVADAETAAAIEGVAQAFAAAGANLSEVRLPPLDLINAVNAVILQDEGFAIHAADLASRPQDFSALTRRALLPGAFQEPGVVRLARSRAAELTAAVDAAVAKVDVLLTASSMVPACRIDAPAEIARTYMLQARAPFNVTGHPALAMMAGLSAGGLPLSVQLVAASGADRTLIDAAAAYETLRPPCRAIESPPL